MSETTAGEECAAGVFTHHRSLDQKHTTVTSIKARANQLLGIAPARPIGGIHYEKHTKHDRI